MSSAGSGANSSDLQQMNRILVLTLLRKFKTTTRAELARITGLKRATITNIINEFIDCKIVKEIGITDGEKGRRSIQIAIDPGNRRVIAVRLARKYFTVGLFDILGNIFYKDTTPLELKNGSEYALRLIKNKVHELYDDNSNIFAIGVALPGPYLKTEDKIVQISDFPGWENVSIVKELQDEFHIPVYAEHDSNASALTEWWFGSSAPRVDSDSVLLNIIAGQGVGAGLVQNGVIYHGRHGIAGELGHTSIDYKGKKCACGNRGCLDLYCSSIVLIQNIQEHLPDYPESVLKNQLINLKTIKEAVQLGDELAIHEIRAMSRFLGVGIANAIKVYDPDVVVIGDELADVGGEYLLQEVMTVLKRRILPTILQNIDVKLSTIDNPMLSGAMCVAVDNVFKNIHLLGTPPENVN